jgi:hypothetical protein
MHESEVQSSAATQLGTSPILCLLLRRHSVPNTVFLLVSHDVIDFRGYEDADDNQVDDDEVLIAAVVFGLVISLVDEGGNDIAELDAHLNNLSAFWNVLTRNCRKVTSYVIGGSRDGSRSYIVRVGRAPTDQNGI